MTSLAALFQRSKPAAGGIALAAAFALALSGCATGTGPGTEGESTNAPETAAVEPTAAPDADQIKANVIVLDARFDAATGTLEVSSIVNNHIGEGTCTVEATSADGETVTTENAALPDAQSTVCPTATFEGLAAGEWSVVVTFDSEEAHGVSESTVAEAL